jgi:hypothetical protein
MMTLRALFAAAFSERNRLAGSNRVLTARNLRRLGRKSRGPRAQPVPTYHEPDVNMFGESPSAII